MSLRAFNSKTVISQLNLYLEFLFSLVHQHLKVHTQVFSLPSWNFGLVVESPLICLIVSELQPFFLHLKSRTSQCTMYRFQEVKNVSYFDSCDSRQSLRFPQFPCNEILLRTFYQRLSYLSTSRRGQDFYPPLLAFSRKWLGRRKRPKVCTWDIIIIIT